VAIREVWAGIALDERPQICYNYRIRGLINIDVFGFTGAEPPTAWGSVCILCILAMQIELPAHSSKLETIVN